MNTPLSTGILLLYTGSPASADPAAVRRYLRRFLMDPFVMDMPRWRRALLVHLIIAPLRSRKSARKYRAIWTERGSPLVAHTRDFEAALAGTLSHQGSVCALATGAAYGAPTVANAVDALLRAGAKRIVALPLFPQYAGATWGSLLAVMEAALPPPGDPQRPAVVVPPPFFDSPDYLRAMAAHAQPYIEAFRPDHVLFSYHGLPLRQALAPVPGGAANYQAQCEQSTGLLVSMLGLPADRCSMAYQSRFGRGWQQPLTADILQELAGKGCRRVAVLAPSFVADCLETLEELDLEGRDLFLRAGGDAWLRVPALNTHPEWIRAATAILEVCVNQ